LSVAAIVDIVSLSWDVSTRSDQAQGESDVQGGRRHGSVRDGEEVWVGTDGGSPEGDQDGDSGDERLHGGAPQRNGV
jgi:hypothetical protein